MLSFLVLSIVAIWCVSWSSARPSVSLSDRDYTYIMSNRQLADHESPGQQRVALLRRDHSYRKPSQVLADHIHRIMDHMNGLTATVHPRLMYMYNLLKKDMLYEPQGSYGQRHHVAEILDHYRTPKPKYDVNKLNRIYTTEADG